MATTTADGTPLATSAVLMSASRHISTRCGAENRAFLECKKNDENPATCVKQGKDVTSCVISLLKELNSTCSEQFGAYAKCMDYYGSEFEMCRKQQATFDKACPAASSEGSSS